MNETTALMNIVKVSEEVDERRVNELLSEGWKLLHVYSSNRYVEDDGNRDAFFVLGLPSDSAQ